MVIPKQMLCPAKALTVHLFQKGVPYACVAQKVWMCPNTNAPTDLYERCGMQAIVCTPGELGGFYVLMYYGLHLEDRLHMITDFHRTNRRSATGKPAPSWLHYAQGFIFLEKNQATQVRDGDGPRTWSW